MPLPGESGMNASGAEHARVAAAKTWNKSVRTAEAAWCHDMTGSSWNAWVPVHAGTARIDGCVAAPEFM